MVQSSKCIVGKCLSRVKKGRTENGTFQKVWLDEHKSVLLSGLKLQDDDGWSWSGLISLHLKGLVSESEAWQVQSFIVATSTFDITRCPSLRRVIRHWHWFPREVTGSPSWRYSKAVWTENWAAPGGPDWTVWLGKVTFGDVFQPQSLSMCDCPMHFPWWQKRRENTEGQLLQWVIARSISAAFFLEERYTFSGTGALVFKTETKGRGCQ